MFPNIIICRADRDVDDSIRQKLSLFCDVPKDQIFTSIDLDSIYQLPMDFHHQGLDEKITELLGMWTAAPSIEDLKRVIYNYQNPTRQVKIGIVGKYTELIESYKSLDEALHHGAIANQVEFVPVYIDAEELGSEKRTESLLKDVDGILVPGGFGERGTEGKINAIKYARENNLPFFGICLGMQLAIIEFARHVCGIKDATSSEFETPGTPVIDFIEGQSKDVAKGGSMRLGAYNCELKPKTLAREIYGEGMISERHRHRLEVNNEFVAQYEKVV